KSEKKLNIADFDQSQIKFGHSVLNGLSVLENFTVTEGQYLASDFRSGFMSICVVNKGKGTFTLNMEKVAVKENSLFHISPNTIIGGGSGKLTISGISFSSDFISEVGMPERSSELFNYFSSKYYPVWELEEEDAALVNNQIRYVLERLHKFSIHPYGKEILVHVFHVFLFEIGALDRKS